MTAILLVYREHKAFLPKGCFSLVKWSPFEMKSDALKSRISQA